MSCGGFFPLGVAYKTILTGIMIPVAIVPHEGMSAELIEINLPRAVPVTRWRLVGMGFVPAQDIHSHGGGVGLIEVLMDG